MRRHKINGISDANRMEKGKSLDNSTLVKDDRFQALFSSPDFALDPTDPRYKAEVHSHIVKKKPPSNIFEHQYNRIEDGNNGSKQKNRLNSMSETGLLVTRLKKHAKAKKRK